MAVDRPTFSESWHRVKELKPRLRASIQTFRQQYRGRLWQVLSDPAANQFFRLDEPAYHFVALLDGRKNIAEVWDICNTELGDRAPTQGEVIRLLGQLYTSNLLHADLPPDAHQMFDRYRKRRVREVGGYFMNFLFIRIPLFDPNNILQAWVKVFGWMFGPIGFLVWAAIVGMGLYHITGNWEALWASADPQQLLKTENLALLYLSFALIKAIHEFGHGFACAHYGLKNGTGGECHTMGIMLLVFMPVPYVDASSSWAFRSKWQRAMVGAGGMYIELAVASVAAVIWANTSEASLINAICYNVMFIASVSTILFNSNPLLRFDGYYILSDLLEIANLNQRSKQYLYYVVKKYVYGARKSQNPAHTVGERWWLMFFAIASTIYRVIICVGIILYIGSMLAILGIIMALASVVVWVFVPLGKFIKFLAINPELERVRSRAVLATLLFIASLVYLIGFIKFDDHNRAEGIIRTAQMQSIFVESPGEIQSVLPSGTPVVKNTILIDTEDDELIYHRQTLLSRERQLIIQLQIAQSGLSADDQIQKEQAQYYLREIRNVRKELQLNQQKIDALKIRAPFDGIWVSPSASRIKGLYAQPDGKPLGQVINRDELLIVAHTNQEIGPRILNEVGIDAEVEMRIKGRADLQFKGKIVKILRIGDRQPDSEAMATVAGGDINIDMQNSDQLQASEPIFKIHIEPIVDDKEELKKLLVGQRMVIRFTLPEKTLATQWWLLIRQLLQRQFNA